MQSIDTRKVQEEIIAIIGRFGVNKSELAKAIGFTPQRLQYTLDTMVHFLALLIKTVRDMIADGKITPEEHEDTLKKIKAYRIEFSDHLNTLEKLIQGTTKTTHSFEMVR